MSSKLTTLLKCPSCHISYRENDPHAEEVYQVDLVKEEQEEQEKQCLWIYWKAVLGQASGCSTLPTMNTLIGQPQVTDECSMFWDVYPPKSYLLEYPDKHSPDRYNYSGI